MSTQDILPAAAAPWWQRQPKGGQPFISAQVAPLLPQPSGPVAPPTTATEPATESDHSEHDLLAEQSLAQLTIAMAELEQLRSAAAELQAAKDEIQRISATGARREHELSTVRAEGDRAAATAADMAGQLAAVRTQLAAEQEARATDQERSARSAQAISQQAAAQRSSLSEEVMGLQHQLRAVLDGVGERDDALAESERTLQARDAALSVLRAELHDERRRAADQHERLTQHWQMQQEASQQKALISAEAQARQDDQQRSVHAGKIAALEAELKDARERNLRHDATVEQTARELHAREADAVELRNELDRQTRSAAERLQQAEHALRLAQSAHAEDAQRRETQLAVERAASAANVEALAAELSGLRLSLKEQSAAEQIHLQLLEQSAATADLESILLDERESAAQELQHAGERLQQALDAAEIPPVTTELIAQRDASRSAVRTLSGEVSALKGELAAVHATANDRDRLVRAAQAQAEGMQALETRNAALARENALLRAQLAAVLADPVEPATDHPRSERTSAPQSEAAEAEPVEVQTPRATQRAIPQQRLAPASGLHAWQVEALESWTAAGKVGVIQAVTGSGKSRVGVVAAATALAEGKRVLILVPTLALQRQWQKVILESLPGAAVGLLNGDVKDSLNHCDVLVATPISAANAMGTLPKSTHGLLIADEAHRYGSATFSRALDPAYSQRLGLSATYQRGNEGDPLYLEPYFQGIVFDLGYERALKDDVIAPYRVALVGVDLLPREQDEYDEYDAAVKKARQDLWSLGERATDFGEFMRRVNELADSKGATKDIWAARRYRSNANKRRVILAETQAKAGALATLVDCVSAAHGTLIFTQTKASAEAAAQLFKSHGLLTGAVYSGQDDDEFQLKMDEFAAQTLDVLAAPKLLDEGIDVPEADLGIIVAASRSKRQMSQRIGRVIRKKESGGPGRIVILFVRGTIEDPLLGDGSDYLDVFLPYAQASEVFSGDAALEGLPRFLDARDQRPRWEGLDRRAEHMALMAETELSETSQFDDLDDWGDEELEEAPEPDVWELINSDREQLSDHSADEDDPNLDGTAATRLVDTWFAL